MEKSDPGAECLLRRKGESCDRYDEHLSLLPPENENQLTKSGKWLAQNPDLLTYADFLLLPPIVLFLS